MILLKINILIFCHNCLQALLLLMFFNVSVYNLKSQTLSMLPGNKPFYKIEQEMEEKMLLNSPDWNRINELKMLRDNFEGLAPSYNQIINEIKQQYKFDTKPTISSTNNNAVKVPTADEIMKTANNKTFPPVIEDPNKNNINKNPLSTGNGKYGNDIETFYNDINLVSAINSNTNKMKYYDSDAYKKEAFFK